MHLTVALLALLTVCQADQWAVLVAGSNEYWNYRHQADVCHAYQILHANGYPDDRIIVMMYDDIANNPDNPFPGNIINRPNGTNVYPGVPKDYTNAQVTPENFLNIIKGIKTDSTQKVLQSGPNDDVFIYFADHGGPGLIAFPNEYLYAHDLIDALKYMHKNKMYQTLVFYMEACESGSMFDGFLTDDMNIYATTASTPFESSWACYFDVSRGTYLGDVYSINWLENSDGFHIDSESLQDQFEIDRIETKTSKVCEYGNVSIAQNPLYNYLAYNYTPGDQPPNSMCPIHKSNLSMNTLDTRWAQFKYYTDNDMENDYILLYLKVFEQVNYILQQYGHKLYLPADNPCNAGSLKLDTRCMQQHVEQIEQHVGKFAEPTLSYLKHVAKVCYK
jgi:legumain